MHLNFQPCTYLLASTRRGRLYVGVTSHLIKRIQQHRDGVADGHARRYDIKRLAWFELAGTMESAIAREKQLKNWQRAWKLDLVEATNPDWRDLAEDIGFAPLQP